MGSNIHVYKYTTITQAVELASITLPGRVITPYPIRTGPLDLTGREATAAKEGEFVPPAVHIVLKRST